MDKIKRREKGKKLRKEVMRGKEVMEKSREAEREVEREKGWRQGRRDKWNKGKKKTLLKV